MKKLIASIKLKPQLWLWLAIGSYFLLFSLICVWKYFQFGYNGLDLAIYNQVFYNSVHGQLFGFTIHPQSYLGDHFELFIVALLPFYYFFQHPLTLLILQTAFLAASAWPLFLIASARLKGVWPLLIAALWLLNPFVQNVNLFEFHLLPFAIFFIFWTFYFYWQKKFPLFLLFALMALLTREDVALVIFMFGIIALLEKRPLQWIVWPMLASTLWFALALKAIAHFSPAGSYKYLVYYGWLGSNLREIIVNFFVEPLTALKRLLRPGNIMLLPMLFLPTGFLNLFRPKYLLLALPIFLQLALSQANNAIIAIKLHYVSLLLPPLFIALIFSWHYLIAELPQSKLARFLKNNLAVAKIILLVAALYGLLTLGPGLGVISKLIKPAYTTPEKQARQDLLKSISVDTPVLANNELLTNLSGRQEIYALHYAFIGKQQFSELDYQLPASVKTWVVNFDDLLSYPVQFKNNPKLLEYYFKGDDKLRKIIEEQGLKPKQIIDSLVLFAKNAAGPELYHPNATMSEITKRQNIDLGGKMTFLGWTPLSATANQTGNANLLPISLYFRAEQKMDKNFQLKLTVKNNHGQIVHDKLYPLAYGLYPTADWLPGQIIKINYWFLLSAQFATGDYQLSAQILDYDGLVTLDGVRAAILKITREYPLGPALDLGTLTIN